MKKLFVLLFAASAALSSLTASAQTWTADKSHSKLGFSITHMMVSDVEGSFKTFESTIVSSKPDFSDAVINLTADINSVNTEDEKRDGHLKSADFFDAEKYPKLTFKSTSIKKVAANKYKVNGQLTLHGVTKAVVLDAVLRGTTVNQAKKTVAGFKVTGTIKRADFALGTKYPNAMLSDEIALNANTEFVKD
ncbi:YceI family protein [Pedobacter sp. MC2016-15]|uniref:YceI family protein n=1 Tax=Pedobacter sp. MC2016-15 TaxID=2994473 RepID=UPI00224824BD|nr:YceI family protein [Pedobacter sp. MC2016-15]MCX2479889.1 YceI family protein [Pedobacter sp. MC2016-15]